MNLLDTRIGTDEREDTMAVLGEHFAAGRLFVHEYDQRMTATIEAQTRAQVRALFDDLPAPHPGFMRPPPPPAPPATIQPAVLPAGRSDKSRVAAGLLQIMFPFGTGRFYTGHTKVAVAQLLLVFVGVGVIWSLIDGVLLLAVGGTDPAGRRLSI